jgi:hypothetical protein
VFLFCCQYFYQADDLVIFLVYFPGLVTKLMDYAVLVYWHIVQLNKSFGLLDQSPERWYNLRREVKRLQDEAEDGVQYKVLFLG